VYLSFEFAFILICVLTSMKEEDGEREEERRSGVG
jgi:hypothetical protein